MAISATEHEAVKRTPPHPEPTAKPQTTGPRPPGGTRELLALAAPGRQPELHDRPGFRRHLSSGPSRPA